ncbi:type II secretion system protein C [Lysobacter maris]|uniref:Type II secretion system protein C n=1 Tax=Marilutibacter maris TaxID=1605891 RepID=A0A2U9TBG1_9GAMM|nr:type II secretion system protein C [Lysobacter maris]
MWTAAPVPALAAIRDISASDLRERIGRRLPAALEVALVILLALQAARLIWLAVVPPAPFGEVAPPEASAAADAFAIDADLFYRRDAVSEAAGAEQALGYRLFGLRAASADGGMPASAILAGKDGAQRAYRDGEAIADGITLVRVGEDHVVLRAGGSEHRIDLATPASPPMPASTARTRPLASPGTTSAATRADPASGSTGAIAPSQLLASTGLRANLDGGYTLTPRGDGVLFRRAGLAPGDVLMAVDGRPLDRERLGELAGELKNRSEVVLTVERGGQSRTITLQAEQP